MATLTGREQIFTKVEEIDDSNIVKVLQDAYKIHKKNRTDIEKLYNYYKGKQAILNRVKEVRPEINNKIVINKANEIVTFKTGYLLYSPIQYVARNKEVSEIISKLNTYMDIQGKTTSDKELVDWMHIAGTGFRITLPNKDNISEIPFVSYTLDPTSTFVTYNALDVSNEPTLGVTYFKNQDKKEVFECYTKDKYYRIIDNKVVDSQPIYCGGIPIVEYPLNKPRIGSFELVIGLLDAINLVTSNRADGIEQFVQALLLFHNVDIDTDEVKALKDLGAIKYRDSGNLKGEITYLVSQLDQTNTQTLVDDMVNDVLAIVGMPPTNSSGGSTKDTGQAVVLRDGWYLAETRAKDTENIFKFSEYKTLSLISFICEHSSDLRFTLADIEIKFTRKNYENIASKVSVLTQLLQNDKVAPRLAFITSNLFPDGESAYMESMKYLEEQAKKEEEVAGQGLQINNRSNQDNREAFEQAEASGSED